MITDFRELVGACRQEAEERQYNSVYLERIQAGWNRIQTWMDAQGLAQYSREIGLRFCSEELGGYLSRQGMTNEDHCTLRAARMLISYQEDGDFELRAPRIEHILSGPVGDAANHYLESRKNVLSNPSYRDKKLYLCHISEYCQQEDITLDELTSDEIEAFFEHMHYSLASRHNCAGCLRGFLRYCYDTRITARDMSAFVLPDNYKKNCKLPTTYEEDEIRAMLAAVERSSAIGKRDYLILLLAAEYGWRSMDITSFCFGNIDWDRNKIVFIQHKTCAIVEYPLLSSVGNAVIDYLKHGRPESNAEQIIVAHTNGHRGEPLSSPTIHSIVTRYIRKANIPNWQNKKHGAHSLRHSLATNLLKKNIPMPIISTVMGHQNTSTTSIYISLDVEKLRKCSIPIPPIHSPYYTMEVNER